MHEGDAPDRRPILVAQVDRAIRLKYISVITHGAMLSAERAQSLWDAGVNQFNISLDYLDERHDRARGIPGLAAKILNVVPAMRAHGIDGIRFNTVIKNDNLDEILPIVRAAEQLGVGVNFSLYTDAKNGNRQHLIVGDDLARAEAVVAELLAYKRRRRGVITNSDYYLEQIPRYLRGEMREPLKTDIAFSIRRRERPFSRRGRARARAENSRPLFCA